MIEEIIRDLDNRIENMLHDSDGFWNQVKIEDIGLDRQSQFL